MVSFFLMFTPILGESIRFGEPIFQMGWFKTRTSNSTAKMQQILVETPIVDEIPNVQPSYLTHCFFVASTLDILHEKPPEFKDSTWFTISFFLWDMIPEKKHISYYNVRAIYKRLKMLNRKVLISRKTSKLTWLQIDETPRKQLLKWSSSIAVRFFRQWFWSTWLYVRTWLGHMCW